VENGLTWRRTGSHGGWDLVALLRNRQMAENDVSIGGMMGRDSVSREAMSFGRLPE